MSAEPEDQTPEPLEPSPRPLQGGAAGLLRAVGRGVDKAARNRTIFGLRHHVVAEQFRRQIASPLRETIEQARAAIAAGRANIDAANRAGEHMFAEVSDENLARLIRAAQVHWTIYLVMAMVSCLFLVAGAHARGMASFAAILSSITGLMYSTALMLRAGHDVAQMRERRRIDFRELFDHLDVYWCPVPASSWHGIAVRYLIAPLVATLLVAAPVVAVVASG